MGLLDKLWDDILAGPRPDSGLGKLRNKSKSSAAALSSGEGAKMDVEGGAGRSYSEALATSSSDMDLEQRVTRSIMIRRPSQSSDTTLAPVASPAGASPPLSPFGAAATGRSEWHRARRKSMSDAYGRRVSEGSRSSAPPHEV